MNIIHRTTTRGKRAAAAALAAIGLMALAGCSPSSTASPTASELVVPSKGSVITEALTADQVSRDPALAAVAAQDQQLRYKRLSDSYPGVSLPETAVKKFVTLDEWPTAYADCMTAAGFPSSVTADGGVQTSNSEAQRQAGDIAGYVCESEYPADPRFTSPLSEEQLKTLYSYYVDTLVPCLEAEGVVVSAPPSLQVFVQDNASNKSWTPYNEISPESQERWTELNNTCPQVPTTLYTQ